MTALDDRPHLQLAEQRDLTCGHRRPDEPACGSESGLVRLFIGWRCPEHTLSGAQVYEVAPTRLAPLGRPDLTVVDDRATGPGGRAVSVPSRLPDPGHPGAQVQSDPTPAAAQAAALAWGKSGRPRRRLLEQFIAVGDDGMTSWEAWSWYRATHGEIDLYSLRPRLTELKHDGWLCDSGRRRHPRGHGDTAAPSEEVLVLTARGRIEATTTGVSR